MKHALYTVKIGKMFKCNSDVILLRQLLFQAADCAFLLSHNVLKVFDLFPLGTKLSALPHFQQTNFLHFLMPLTDL